MKKLTDFRALKVRSDLWIQTLHLALCGGSLKKCILPLSCTRGDYQMGIVLLILGPCYVQKTVWLILIDTALCLHRQVMNDKPRKKSSKNNPASGKSRSDRPIRTGHAWRA